MNSVPSFDEWKKKKEAAENARYAEYEDVYRAWAGGDQSAPAKAFSNLSFSDEDIAGWRSWHDQNAPRLDAEYTFRGLDQDLIKTVGDSFKATWGDKYYYDMFDAEDYRRMQAGQIPKYLDKKYNLNDPVDQYLYSNGLPWQDEFSNAYSEAVGKYNADIAEKNAAIEEENAYQGQYASFKNELYSKWADAQYAERQAAIAEGRLENRISPEPFIVELLAQDKYLDVAQNFKVNGAMGPDDVSDYDTLEDYIAGTKKKENPRAFSVGDLYGEFMPMYQTGLAKTERAAVLANEQARQMYVASVDVETETANATAATEKIVGIDEQISALRTQKNTAPRYRKGQAVVDALSTQIAALEAQKEEAAAAKAAAEERLATREYIVNEDKANALVAEITARPDYEERKQPIPEMMGKFASAPEGWTQHGKDTYNYINEMAEYNRARNDPDKFAVIDPLLFKQMGFRRDSDANSAVYTSMSETQLGVFNYLAATQGEAAAFAYIDMLRPIINQATAESSQHMAETLANSGPVGAIAANVGTVAMNVFAKPREAVIAATGSLIGEPVERNDPRLALTRLSDGIRAETARAIETNLGGTWGQLVAGSYGIGMSIADTAARIALTGGFGAGGASTIGQVFNLASAGAGAMASTINSVLDKGGTSKQAMTLGFIAGAVEVVTEKMGLDNLFKMGAAGTLKEFAAGMVKQGAIEASEEMISETANIISDYIFMAEKSDIKRNIAAYMADGATESQAAGRAIGDGVWQVLMSGVGGFVSGLFLGSIQQGKTAYDMGNDPNAVVNPDPSTPTLPGAVPSNSYNGPTGKIRRGMSMARAMQLEAEWTANASAEETTKSWADPQTVQARIEAETRATEDSGTARTNDERVQFAQDLAVLDLDTTEIDKVLQVYDYFASAPGGWLSDAGVAALKQIESVVRQATRMITEAKTALTVQQEEARQRLEKKYSQAQAAAQARDTAAFDQAMNEYAPAAQMAQLKNEAAKAKVDNKVETQQEKVMDAVEKAEAQIAVEETELQTTVAATLAQDAPGTHQELQNQSGAVEAGISSTAFTNDKESDIIPTQNSDIYEQLVEQALENGELDGTQDAERAERDLRYVQDLASGNLIDADPATRESQTKTREALDTLDAAERAGDTRTPYEILMGLEPQAKGDTANDKSTPRKDAGREQAGKAAVSGARQVVRPDTKTGTAAGRDIRAAVPAGRPDAGGRGGAASAGRESASEAARAARDRARDYAVSVRDGSGWTPAVTTALAESVDAFNERIAQMNAVSGVNAPPLRASDLRPAANVSEKTIKRVEHFHWRTGLEVFLFDAEPGADVFDGVENGMGIFARNTDSKYLSFTLGHEGGHYEMRYNPAVARQLEAMYEQLSADEKQAYADMQDETACQIYGDGAKAAMDPVTLRKEYLADMFGMYEYDLRQDKEAVNRLLSQLGISEDTYYEQFKSAIEAVYAAAAIPENDLRDEVLALTGMNFSNREFARPLYSKMLREVKAYKGEKISVDGLENYLRGRGVKSEEIAWSGVKPFVEGKKSVTKTELAEFLSNNQLDVQTITRQAASQTPEYAELTAKMHDEIFDNFVPAFEALTGLQVNPDALDAADHPADAIDTMLMRSLNRVGLAPIDMTDTQRELYDQCTTARDAIADLEYARTYSHEVREPKFDLYKLPGGEKYREVLFTLPSITGSYKSPHWHEQNVVAHTRLQDFTANDGGKVLFVDEVQSDWHETGRENGYTTPELMQTRQARMDELRAAIDELDYLEFHEGLINAIRDSMPEVRPVPQHTAVHWLRMLREGDPKLEQAGDEYQLTFSNSESYTVPDSVASAIQRYTAYRGEYYRLTNELRVLRRLADTGVADAPFKETWHEYILKRVLRMAAEGDYDYVAWTTGKMQADRYNLAQQVGTISISQVERPGSAQTQYAVLTHTPRGIELNAASGVYTAEQVVSLFGKDLGSRMLAAADAKAGTGWPSRFEGDDLVIGGEGMRNFYDIGGKSKQNIPRFMNKYVKQWDSRVEEIAMNGYTAPGVKVTDAMRESVLYDGQPMFSQRSFEDNDRAVAPALYSKMQQEVEAYKGDKISADGLENYLRGRGVKAEEIAWSGLSEFLEGKKSVPKAELLEFLRNNQLQIQQITKRSLTVPPVLKNVPEAIQYKIDIATSDIILARDAFRHAYNNLRGADIQPRDLYSGDARWQDDPRAWYIYDYGTFLSSVRIAEECFKLHRPPARGYAGPYAEYYASCENAISRLTAATDELRQTLNQAEPYVLRQNTSRAAMVEQINKFADAFFELTGQRVRAVEELYDEEYPQEYCDMHLYRGVRAMGTSPDELPPEKLAIYERCAEAVSAMERIYDDKKQDLLENADSYSTEPQYEGYALPGGTRYRELLFRLPRIGSYDSPHWEEKSVVAHTRWQDFKTPDGDKVLFVDEVQSDWHEAGREKGYSTGAERARADELAAEIVRLETEISSCRAALYKSERPLLEALQDWRYAVDTVPVPVFSSDGDDTVITFDDATTFTLARTAAGHARDYVSLVQGQQKLHEMQKPFKDLYARVDDAPFKETWHEFIMKQALRAAAEGDYDYVAWTTGKMQADRYDLARQVRSIGVSAYTQNDETLYSFSLDGNTYSPQEFHNAASIIRIFGKDLGSRMIAAADAEADTGAVAMFEGDDLIIGGEGMRNFYDIGGKSKQNIPRFMDKYVKKWGSSVAPITIQGLRDTTYDVPAVKVTDEMRESVMYVGQPLFSQRSFEDDGQEDYSNEPTSKVAKNMQTALDLFAAGITPDEYYEQDPKVFDYAVAKLLRGIYLRNGVPVGGALAEQTLGSALQNADNWKQRPNIILSATFPQRLFENLGAWRREADSSARAANYLEGERLKDLYWYYGLKQGAEKNRWQAAERDLIAKAYGNGGIYESVLAQLIGEGKLGHEVASASRYDAHGMVVPVAGGVVAVDNKGRLTVLADGEKIYIFDENYRRRMRNANKTIRTIMNSNNPSMTDADKQAAIRKAQIAAATVMPRVFSGTVKVERTGDTLVVRSEDGNELTRVTNGKTPDVACAERTADALQVFYRRVFDAQQQVLVKNGYRPMGHVTEYFPHQGRTDAGLSAFIATLRGESEQLPTAISGLTSMFAPGKPWAAHLLARIGTFTEFDAIRGFNKYVQAAGDLIYYTPVIQRLRQLEKYLRDRAGDRGTVNTALVSWLHNYTNQLANKKADIDRAFEDIGGRAAYTVSDKLTSLFGAASVAGNVSTAMSNFISYLSALPGINPKYVPSAFVKTILAEFASIANKGDEFIDKIPFLTRRFNAYESILTDRGAKIRRAGGKALGLLFQSVDRLSTEAAARAKYAEMRAAGYAEQDALQKTDDFLTKVFADRSKGMTPAIFSSKLFKPFAQFQLEVTNQLSHGRDIVRQGIGEQIDKVIRENGSVIDGINFADADKHIRAFPLRDLARLFMYALLMSVWGLVTRGTMGRDQTWNPYGMAKDFARDTKTDGLTDALVGLGENTLENLPFTSLFGEGGRIPALGGIENVRDAVATLFDEDTTTEQKLGAGLKGAVSFVPGGAQISKTTRGIMANKKGGYYSDAGSLRYPIDEDEFWKTAIFGPSAAAPEGYTWGADYLTTSKSEKYRALRAATDVPSEDIYDFLLDYDGGAPKAERLIAIATADQNGDGTPDFKSAGFDTIAEVLGVSYEGDIAAAAKKSADSWYKNKERSADLTAEEKQAAKERYDMYLEMISSIRR